MFKNLKKLFQQSDRSLRPNENEIYAELCNVLQGALLPIGFTETKEEYAIGKIAKYQRDMLLVELYLDHREGEFLFYASSDVQDPISPPRQVSMTFPIINYTDEDKIAMQVKLEDWIKTIE